MKAIGIICGTKLEDAYQILTNEADRCGDVCYTDFNGTVMRSDQPLEEFYQKYYGKSGAEHQKDISEELMRILQFNIDDVIRVEAESYAASIPQFEHNRKYSVDDFTAGAKWGLENGWMKIPRDKDGFAIDVYLDMMFESMPFIIADTRYNDADVVFDVDWRKDIVKKPQYSHWKPLKLPKR